MRLFMDDPGVFAPLAAATAAPAVPEPDERTLWARLAGDARAHAAPAPVSGFWRAGYAVNEAPASQYDVLRGLAATGDLPPGNLFTLAGAGHGFHGQHGRAWHAHRGNLHLCAVLEADGPAGERLPLLPALAALAALDAVRAGAGDGRAAGIKWVNDVLLGGAKVGGVLTAARTVGGRLERVIMGVGLNVAVAPALAPDGAGLPTARLAAAAGPPPELGVVAAALLAAIATRWRALAADGPAPLLADYRAASVVVGRMVTVQPERPADGPPRQGRVVGIGDDLSLLLDDGGDPVTRGRLVFAPA